MEDAVKKILIASTLALALAGCGTAQGDRALGGAAIGGATGAVVGGLASGNAGGALAGAAVGAAGGAIIGAATTPRYSRCYIDDYGREICRR
jgi:osmotically inducible lipoprotein OsmB